MPTASSSSRIWQGDSRMTDTDLPLDVANWLDDALEMEPRDISYIDEDGPTDEQMEYFKRGGR